MYVQLSGKSFRVPAVTCGEKAVNGWNTQARTFRTHLKPKRMTSPARWRGCSDTSGLSYRLVFGTDRRQNGIGHDDEIKYGCHKSDRGFCLQYQSRWTRDNVSCIGFRSNVGLFLIMYGSMHYDSSYRRSYRRPSPAQRTCVGFRDCQRGIMIGAVKP